MQTYIVTASATNRRSGIAQDVPACPGLTVTGYLPARRQAELYRHAAQHAAEHGMLDARTVFVSIIREDGTTTNDWYADIVPDAGNGETVSTWHHISGGN